MKVTTRSFLAFVVIALAGCGSAPQRTPSTPAPAGTVGESTAADVSAPEGAPRHSIACAGGNWADCYDKAAAACGDKGYVVLGHGSADASASAGSGAGAGRTAGASARRTVLIECRDWSPR